MPTTPGPRATVTEPPFTVYYIPGGPYWVRWKEFLGFTPWRRCNRVGISDGWLVVLPMNGPDLLVPQHIVRGHVEVSVEDPTARDD